MNQPKQPMHIAIIGAGIGGLALAIGLRRQGVPYTLYESAPGYAVVGAGVGLGPNAMRAMQLIDPQLRSLYDDIKSGNLTPGKEDVMGEALMIEEGFGEKRGWKPKPWGAPCFTRTSAHRKALLDVMTSLIPSETVVFNKRARSIEQKAEKVIVAFEDGQVVEVSAVIGCDGVKGATRRAVLTDYPEHIEPTYTGKYCYRAIVPMQDARSILGDLACDAKMYMGSGMNITTYPISRGAEINVVAFKRDTGPWTHPTLTKEVSREEMRADFEADERLLRLLDWAKPMQWSLWHHDETPIYYNNRICLVGDSAHATTPHQAAGAGQCLEDAYVLSHLLGALQDPGDLKAAFNVFDSIRRPRAQKVVTTSTEAGKLYNFVHPEAGSDMEMIVANLNQRFFWLWEHDLEADMVKAKEQLFRATSNGIAATKPIEHLQSASVEIAC